MLQLGLPEPLPFPPPPPFTPLVLLAAAFVVASLRRALAATPFKCRRTRLKYAKLLEHLVSKALTPSASRATSYQLWGLCDSGDSAATIGHSGLPICGCTCSSCQAKLPVLVAHNVYLSLSLSVSVCVCVLVWGPHKLAQASEASTMGVAEKTVKIFEQKRQIYGEVWEKWKRRIKPL